MVGPRPAIIVHGGAGRGSGESREARLAGYLKAAAIGWKAIESGRTALDADPLFNDWNASGPDVEAGP